MADDPVTGPGDEPHPFDVRTVRYLVRLMSQHDLSEIDLQEGDRRLRLRRGPRIVAGAAPVALPTAGAAPAAAGPAGPTPAAAAPAAPAKNLIEIKAPTVGKFYSQKDPGSPPYVQVGTRVTPTTVVCLIEAMKLYNEITADCAGVVTEVLVKNEEFVEYGAVLFRVDPAG